MRKEFLEFERLSEKFNEQFTRSSSHEDLSHELRECVRNRLLFTVAKSFRLVLLGNYVGVLCMCVYPIVTFLFFSFSYNIPFACDLFIPEKLVGPGR